MARTVRRAMDDVGSNSWNVAGHEPPLVSIVIPTRDRPESLRKALASVLEQNYERLEIIVVDDASKADIAPVISSFHDERISLLKHETSTGPSVARNEGILASKGEFISFLDDDDEMLPDKIAAHIEDLAQKGWRYHVSYCLGEVYDDAQGEIIRTHDQGWDGEHLEQLIDGRIKIPTVCLLISRGSLRKVGGFDPQLKSMEDRELLIRLAELNEFAFVNRVLVRIHFRQAGRLSLDKQARLDAQSRIYQAHRALFWRHPRALSGFFMNYAFELLDQKQHSQALIQFSKAIIADPFVPRPYIAMGLGLKIALSSS